MSSAGFQLVGEAIWEISVERSDCLGMSTCNEQYKVAICLFCDGGFLPYAAYTAKSIRQHPDNSDFDIYVFTEQLEDRTAAFFSDEIGARPILIDPAIP